MNPTQAGRGADPARSCGPEAVHRVLQPLAAQSDVPQVLPGPARLGGRAFRRASAGRSRRAERRSGSGTLPAAQVGPCRVRGPRGPHERMTEPLNKIYLLKNNSSLFSF